MRTNWKSVFPERFLPAPKPLRRTAQGPVVPEPKDVKAGDVFPDLWTTISTKNLTKAADMPYDKYCPSIQKDIKKRVCKGCSIYHPSMASVDRHRKGKGCKASQATDSSQEVDAEDEMLPVLTAQNVSVAVAPLLSIADIAKKLPFYEDDGSDSSDEEYCE